MLADIWNFLMSWMPLPLLPLWLAFFIWFLWRQHQWWNHPDTVRERQKAAYEEAHAYLGGKCCCGRTES